MNNNYSVSVVISNYNYNKYICEAVNSVLYQSYESLEIIIIDDGSTDGSSHLIENTFNTQIKKNKIKLIKKKNGGQLSTFNAAIPYINGNYVFFLDADDLYEPNYITDTLEIYKSHINVDFIFCKLEIFNGDKTNIISSISPFKDNTEIGCTYFSALLGDEMPGIATSGISMKRELLTRILPLEDIETNWKICADVCLKLGSSLSNSYKYFNFKNRVYYRIHEENNFINNPEQKTSHRKLTEYINTSILKKKLISKNNLYIPNAINEKFLNSILLEFSLRGDKSRRIYRKYKKIILNMNLSLPLKLIYIIKLKKLLKKPQDL